MVHLEIFREPLYRTFRAPQCSQANFYISIINFLRYFLPLAIIFSTQGLWKKYGTVYETPKIEFNGDYIAYTTINGPKLVASTFPALNSASGDQFVSSSVRHFYEKKEKLRIILTINTRNSTVSVLDYILFFKVNLDSNVIIQANTGLYQKVQLMNKARKVISSGVLDVHQSTPLENRMDFQSIEEDEVNAQNYAIQNVLQRQTEHPFSLILERKSDITIDSQDFNEDFTVDLTINIPKIQFNYKTDLFELLKWAFIQYFVAFCIVGSILNSLTSKLLNSRTFYVVDSHNKL